MIISQPSPVFGVPGTVVHNAIAPAAYTDLDLSAVVGARKALVFLRVLNGTGAPCIVYARPNGEAASWDTYGISNSGGAIPDAQVNLICLYTDAAGIIEWFSNVVAGTITISAEAYIGI